MSNRFRLNLEAPFLQSATLSQTLTSRVSYQQAAANEVPLQQGADVFLRRPSPQSRAKGIDYTGKTMVRYIDGLEARMLAHMRKHAPHWHRQETEKILRKWSVPQLPAPAPRWAPPIDRRAEAKDYAAALLNERLRTRMDRFAEIRSARLINDGDRPQLRRSFRMKQ